MKRNILVTFCTCLVLTLVAFFFSNSQKNVERTDVLRIGFIYENDESTPYTYNFSLAKNAVEHLFGDRVEVYTQSNVPEDATAEVVHTMCSQGCEMIFINSYAEDVLTLAQTYPHVQFCQISYTDNTGKSLPENYHTFKGELYQGRYVSGVAAGLKLQEMIEQGLIEEDQAVAGFVAAFPTSEVISGFTAFLMGIRSVVPQATLKVMYTHTWSSYSLERECAHKLIDLGCIVISQHTDTIGPAIACEESETAIPVFHAGLNQSMTDVAPTTSLIGTRINWSPYITSAVEAILLQKKIETHVAGNVHGNDVSSGFDHGWVEMLDLNPLLAAEGTEMRMNEIIEQFKRGKTDFVFKGNLQGTNPDLPSDTIDLTNGYAEQASTSSPTFHYYLNDIIEIVE